MSKSTHKTCENSSASTVVTFAIRAYSDDLYFENAIDILIDFMEDAHQNISAIVTTTWSTKDKQVEVVVS